MGGKPFVLIQNSGLGNIIDVLISLNQLYETPFPILITWRGFEHQDEIQHWDWGEMQNDILKAARLPYVLLEEDIEGSILKLEKTINKTQKPVALIVQRRKHLDETS